MHMKLIMVYNITSNCDTQHLATRHNIILIYGSLWRDPTTSHIVESCPLTKLNGGGGAENVGPENAGPKNGGPNRRA